jgi:hypothetical protein
MSRECPVTTLNCHNSACASQCQLQNPFNSPTQIAMQRLQREAQQMEMERVLQERRMQREEISAINKLATVIDRLTKERETECYRKPIFVLSTIIDNQTFIIMADIKLTLGATNKNGLFTLIDSVTGAVIAATFSNQAVGANSNPTSATFALDPANLNSAIPTPLAAGTGTIGFSTNATYVDSTGATQTNVQFTLTKNFSVVLGADGVSFDVVF